VVDMDAFREQVKSEAEKAVNDELGRVFGVSSGDDGGDVEAETLSPSEIASRGWDLSDYNSFFGGCREDGFNASSCGSMWTAAKESGLVDTGGVEPADNTGQSGPETASSEAGARDLLILKEDAESSDLTAQYLADPIVDGEIEVVSVESEAGQELLAALDDVPAVPAHLIIEGEKVRVGDLESLFHDKAGAP